MTRRALRNVHLSLSSSRVSSTPNPTATAECPACKRPWRRQFSSTRSKEMTRLRSQMFTWLTSAGKKFEDPIANDTNYLTDYDTLGFRKDNKDSKDRKIRGANNQSEGRDGDQGGNRPRLPFPLNEHFISQPILSTKLREEIWRRVKADKKSVRTVSIELGVEMRRVGAVVRLVELEKLAGPY